MNVWEKYVSLRLTEKNNIDAHKKFEEEKLWPLTLRSVQRSGSEVFKKQKPKGLILTIGFSPEPIAASLAVINPEYACFIHSEESEKTIPQVIKLSKFPNDRYKKYYSSKDNSKKIYSAIQKALSFLMINKKIDRNDIAIDPTGGTKIMPFVGGLLGVNFNLSLVYVSNDHFDTTVRRPIAGSEYFVYNPHLTKMFPDGIFYNVMNLLKTNDFHSANKLWFDNYDKYNLTDLLLYYLTKILKEWDSYEYNSAEKIIDEAIDLCRSMNDDSGDKVLTILINWKIYFSIMQTDNYLVSIDILQNAKRLYEKSEYILGTIMCYSGLENMIDILCSKYKIIRDEVFNIENYPDKELIIKTISENKPYSTYNISGKLGLVHSMIILSAHLPINRTHTKKANELVKFRNNIVHRLSTIDTNKRSEGLKNFINFVDEIFQLVFSYFEEKQNIMQEINYLGYLNNSTLNENSLQTIIEWLTIKNLE